MRILEKIESHIDEEKKGDQTQERVFISAGLDVPLTNILISIFQVQRT